ncbi:hypothetical protein ACIGQE_31980 [Streptomyces sp. NPDC053429]|uniref:hypothetical protein n=1 Tax=Streptomyces sp. NPDC053429 TaxID=3365702 RepID=UPI0037D810D1
MEIDQPHGPYDMDEYGRTAVKEDLPVFPMTRFVGQRILSTREIRYRHRNLVSAVGIVVQFPSATTALGSQHPRRENSCSCPAPCAMLPGMIEREFAIGVAQGELDSLTRIMKRTTRTAVDDLHEEIRQAAVAHGRIFAMHLLRQRVQVLTHAQVIEYVTALQAGTAPPHLVDIATSILGPPLDPVLSVHTIRGADSTQLRN